jgi:hypothetical protein
LLPSLEPVKEPAAPSAAPHPAPHPQTTPPQARQPAAPAKSIQKKSVKFDATSSGKPKPAAVKPPVPAAAPVRRSQRSSKGVPQGEFYKAGYAPSSKVHLDDFDEVSSALVEAYLADREVQHPAPMIPTWSPQSGNPADAQAFVASLPPEPRNLKEAFSGPEAAEWRKAVQEEFDVLVNKGTWSLTKLPDKRKLIATTWVFKRKIGSDGRVERYKARLCAKGFTQVQGLDYDQTFSPVAQYRSLRILLALAATFDLELHQLDVVSAFLNGPIDHELYMAQPDGFNDGSGRVCKLNKAIYGLKQASRCWNSEVHATLLGLGFKQLHGDPCLYILRQGDSIIILFLYVDDMGIASNSETLRRKIVKALQAEYDIKDQGELQWILGMRVTRDRVKRTIALDQSQYITGLLTKFNMLQCKFVPSPALPAAQVSKADSPSTEEEKQAMAEKPYRSLVGSLLHAVNGTRPDICFAVNVACRYMSNPGEAHWFIAKRTLRYLAGTVSLGLKFSAEPAKVPLLCGFSDADWAGDVDDRHSTTGYVFFMAGAPISWATKRQPTVALSSMEAEYMAATAACQEAISLRSLLEEIGLPLKALTLFMDNQSAIFQAQNSVVTARSKHIDIKHHFVRECLEQGRVQVKWISTKDQIADILTKALHSNQFKELREFLQH